MTLRTESTVELSHLRDLMGPNGLYEHARYRTPRVAHGYTTDDNARAVVVAARLAGAEAVLAQCLKFVLSGRSDGGWHNRMNANGRWLDRAGPADTLGRVVWALGVASVNSGPVAGILDAWRHATAFDLRPIRSVSYAVLGAVASRADHDWSNAADPLLDRYRQASPRLGQDRDWLWPEERLTYDNARIPQAMLEVAEAVEDEGLAQRGLDLLEWLVGVEWHGDRFAFTPVGGRGPGERGPGFDQQPIEAWAMADACLVAHRITGSAEWVERAAAAVEWFAGRNHGSRLMFDPDTGAGFDGLHEDGVNQNAGAESTLSYLGAQIVGAELGSLRST